MREPRLDVILATAKTLEIDLSDKLFEIIQKVYEYSKKYSGQKLDTAFLAWSIDNDI